jgi:hypothetical protein
LRWAYISIVIAVHDARLAASSSSGEGPSSSPPALRGSSATSWWSRIEIVWEKFAERRAEARAC